MGDGAVAPLWVEGYEHSLRFTSYIQHVVAFTIFDFEGLCRLASV
jgi:hypothetical protein